MADTKVTEIVLRGPVAERVLKLMTDERYARPEDAVQDALESLEASRDPTLDAWLRGVVVERAAALAADPERALTADQVRARLRVGP